MRDIEGPYLDTNASESLASIVSEGAISDVTSEILENAITEYKVGVYGLHAPRWDATDYTLQGGTLGTMVYTLQGGTLWTTHYKGGLEGRRTPRWDAMH